ncbi:MAG: rhamnogalacturonan lyase [Defluviitaleaceae bacterium]|nr:rhamnogalacturonan lyase [Defluviitaleaceae bacterium]MCL2239734.1 rhamnogalacturonan lyase [Defluviitaleaceae bacterium]
MEKAYKTAYIEEVRGEEDLHLPPVIDGIGVTWRVTEVPWTKKGVPVEMKYDPTKQGVFTFTGTLDAAGMPADTAPQIFVENRHKNTAAYRPRSAEWLDRGVVAVPVNPKAGAGILVKWRLLGTEYGQGLTFNVYRNGGKCNTAPVEILNFVDEGGKPGDTYEVEVTQTGEKSPKAVAWARNFMDIPLQRPADRPNPAVAYGAEYGDAFPITYTPNDLAVADIGGNGKYGILVKWYPSQAQDPGLTPKHTGETIFDAYTLEGKLLWRINLGMNIVSSAHHSIFNFFDLNGDGKAELALKTADGTRIYHPKTDGTLCDLTDTPVHIIGDPKAVWVGGLPNPAKGGAVNHTMLARVASGPEYFTIFDGATGLPIDTVDYFAPYGINAGKWGDASNNRSDRFNGCVAYLPKHGDPEKPYPSVIEVRGHYGPHFVAAYQLIGGKIIKVWEYIHSEWDAGRYQGNHQLAVADVDFDGFDEILFGGIVLDQDGSIVWASNGTRGTINAGHGDAMHVSVMRPDDPAFYLFSPREARPPNNVTLFKAATGEPVWTHCADSKDVGRGMAANVTSLPGFEVWASSGTPMYNICAEKIIATHCGEIGIPGNAPVNFRLYWDGDLLSEMLDGPDGGPLTISKFHYDEGNSSLETLLTLEGTLSNNGTKANAGLVADILGDWREEILVRTADNNALRIYTTDIPTEYVLYTLMHDPVYRLAVNWQNAVYNQPPHLGFYLGEDIRDKVLAGELPTPKIFYASTE